MNLMTSRFVVVAENITARITAEDGVAAQAMRTKAIIFAKTASSQTKSQLHPNQEN